MYKMITKFALLLIPLTFILSCSGGTMDEKKTVYTSIKDIPESTWKKLSEKRIYFGHQSVGFDIIEGVKDVMKENPQIKLHLTEASDPSVFNAPVFAHSKIGKNEYPSSKCTAFTQLMDSGIGTKADIAFFKLCFVDVTANSNTEAVFSEYKKQISSIKQKYSKLTIIHTTIPLTIVQTGVKAWIKNIMGREIGGYSDNIARERLNNEIRKEFSGKDPIFDLSMIESTYPDASRCSFTKDGKIYFSLIPEYSSDGSHLNEKGRKITAERLLVLLANLSS